jgi:hypothetical protein
MGWKLVEKIVRNYFNACLNPLISRTNPILVQVQTCHFHLSSFSSRSLDITIYIICIVIIPRSLSQIDKKKLGEILFIYFLSLSLWWIFVCGLLLLFLVCEWRSVGDSKKSAFPLFHINQSFSRWSILGNFDASAKFSRLVGAK